MGLFAGRYLLVTPISSGGAGAVWRAWDVRHRRYVAAKLLRARDAGSLLRFVREQALRIAHPHVLAPLGWAADDDQVLLTMELVRGGTVAQLLADHGGLPVPYAAVLVDQLLDALTAVHSHGVVHRDVKPSNLLLAPTGRGTPSLRLADFGIAAVLGEPRLTRATRVVGTPGYLGPEALDGADPDPSQDLYAAGVVAVELLTGSRSLAATPDGVPPPVWDWVRTATAADPGDRPTSAAAREAWRAALTDARVGAIDSADPDAVEVFDHLGPLPPGFGPDGPGIGGATVPVIPAVAPGRPMAGPADAPRPATRAGRSGTAGAPPRNPVPPAALARTPGPHPPELTPPPGNTTSRSATAGARPVTRPYPSAAGSVATARPRPPLSATRRGRVLAVALTAAAVGAVLLIAVTVALILR